ncbi:carboxymuconolactone decarboxylase family protein [Shimia sp.]|uniref:carboxymuconolactone decarboxylase family protein n=1 Tax=Shimia sp. TaxID=1954381 RepID=UPI003B8D08B1
MSEFPLHTPQTAPQAARTILKDVQSRLGFIPTMYAKQAEAPVVLKTYRMLDEAFETTSLTTTERLVVLMTVSRYHACDFCMSAHSWRAQIAKLSPPLIEALRTGALTGNTRLDALATFTYAMVDSRGAISDDQLQAFREAGFSRQQALEVILGIAAKVMTNFTNRLAHTPPNPEFGSENVWRASQ